MSELLVCAARSTQGQTPIVQVTPESAGWTYIGFEVYRLKAGEKVTVSTADKETAVIVLEGKCDVTVGQHQFPAVGSRDSVFSELPPEFVYCPPGQPVSFQASVAAEVAVATSVADEGVGEARHVRAEEIAFERRGEGSTTRMIHHLLDEHHPAKKLLLVEVVTPAGNWSSYPPHKHDEEIPSQESYLEETYYYRIDPPHGQALQRVYDKQDLNAVLTPSDGDVVLVPKGYHPVASPPGFTTYYLNVMAGHGRVWKYTIDEDYRHIAPKDGNIMGTVEHGAKR
ncbi:5-deoxy-glucuronate isomerase [Alicyclobacillus fodiniaquatilis]|uniref:5-deoxy-glucuronate isomerase n=1 Tax=Alicyclobacillus fodiniaquatilis TaxID=1661150 RepID=A0ABW4JIN0_9BACL